jgi:hypothetical protein
VTLADQCANPLSYSFSCQENEKGQDDPFAEHPVVAMQ